jgi:hypothetical protein
MHTHALSSFALAMPLLVVSGCVLTPTDGQHLPARDSPFLVQGAAPEPSQTVEVRAYNVCTSDWDVVASTVTGPTPSLPANHWPSSPALYYFSINNVSLAAAAPGGCASTRKYWDDLGNYARLSLLQGNQGLFAGEQESLGCFFATVGADDFYTAGYDCGFDETELVLYNDEIH